jgi:hypothetical protein
MSAKSPENVEVQLTEELPTETVEVDVSYTAYDELAKVCHIEDVDESEVIEFLLIEYADRLPGQRGAFDG